MASEVLWFGIPRWIVVGLAIGFVASCAAACLFYVGTRWFPGTGGGSSTSSTGNERRTIEIREYLDAIDEAYAENHPVDGTSVEFYLPERDVAITFDPRTFYRLERGPTYPVLVEHELPGIHLGSRLPFETPEVDLGPDPEDRELRPYDEAFAVLGLPTGASESEIRQAYREKVKEAHPDHGGDEDEFRRVREAYTTAREAAAGETATPGEAAS
ncbi:J domain-containing protein [Haloglomus litoreum]|uniref:J domain-containing protein n=1 Tax=Haloglomus litoreum TaxID=3034026 RepID=UPI0023E790C8|nr:J domain-containing protein [Haloglomus sp. DT116]